MDIDMDIKELEAFVYVVENCSFSRAAELLHLTQPTISSTTKPFVSIPNDTKKVYYTLSIILYLLQTVNPNNTFAQRFKALLAKYPHIDVAAMGFSFGWDCNTLWK